MNYIENLTKAEKKLIQIANDLNENYQEMTNYEQKIALLKAHLTGSAEIRNLPNQEMRNAEIEKYLQTSDKYEPHYRKYLELKTENKKLYTLWTLWIEINKNARIIALNKDVKDLSNLADLEN